MLLDSARIACRESLVRYAEIVSHDDFLINPGCVPRAQFPPAARGGAYRQGQDANITPTTKPPHKLEVLHYGHFRKATQFVEDLGSYEDGLVAVGQFQNPRAEVHGQFDDTQGRAGGVNA